MASSMNKTTAGQSSHTAHALLHLGTEIDAEVEAAFNRWCEAHVRGNLELPGFLGARRFVKQADYKGVGESPQYLTLYELEDASALTSDAYAAHDQSVPDAFSGHLSFQRSVYREIGVHSGASAGAPANAILHVTVDVEPEYIDDFLKWYPELHVDAVLEAPGMVGARRYENTAPAEGGHLYCTVYDMTDPGVISRPEMIEAARKGACPPDLEPHRVAYNHVYTEILHATAESS